MRRLAPALALLLAVPHLWAAPAAGPNVDADKFEYNLDTRESQWSGNAQMTMTRGTTKERLTADVIHWNETTDTVTADGQVTLTRGNERLLADHLVYHRADGTFTATSIRLGVFPLYIEGETAEGTQTEITVHHAKITYGEPGPWQPTMKAETIIYSPGKYLRMLRSLVGLGEKDILPIPHIRQELGQETAVSYLSFNVGYRSTLGGIADLGLKLPVLPGVLVGGDIGLYTSRGVMFGPSATYGSTDGSGDLQGSLKSGFIMDHGDRTTDLLGNPIPVNRGFVEWQHQQQVTDNLTLDGEINWWSDSDVTRDFRPKEFYPVQMPDNYLESVYTGDNYFASVFARFRPDTFAPVQERLPELRFDVLPTAIGGGFYEQFNASAVSLVEWPTSGGPELASNRLDAFYGLTRPISPVNWFTFTPVVGARVTDYSATVGAAEPGGYLRTLGEVGFDAVMRSSGTFDYKNAEWDIDGLRHLLTPEITYRYIPNANEGQRYIPDIDSQTFTTYLTPLDLGDMRAIDDLHPVNTLRLGVDNILQTRNPDYGSRNLVSLNIADDLNFTRLPGEPDFSDVHTEVALSPAPWVTVTGDEIFEPKTMTLRQFDTGLLLHDGDAWSIQLAGDFLRHEDDDYLLNYNQRLTEAWQALVAVEYGARQHVFNQLATGLSQTLGNTWRVRYLASLNGGPNREGHFAFNVDVEAIKF